jgi:hypothetical protein
LQQGSGEQDTKQMMPPIAALSEDGERGQQKHCS